MPGHSQSRDLAKLYGLITVAFTLFVLVVAMLAQFGLPESVSAVLVMMVTVIAYAVIGISARTLSLAEFYVAGRRVPAGLNGLATAAAFVSAAGFVGLAGAFFGGAAAGLAITIGWVGGFVILAVAVAPYYRKAGAVTLPDFLAVRFGSSAVRLAGAMILLACSVPLLAAAVATAVRVTGAALDVSSVTAMAMTCAVLLLSSLLGGMRAVTLVAGAQAIVILFAMVVPSLVFSLQEFGLPVPQLAYGYAIADAGASAAIDTLAGAFLPVTAFDGFNLLALALCVAAGVATLPHVVARSGTTGGVAQARLSVGWALIVVALVGATAPAVAAFVRYAIPGEIVGLEAADLPQWLFDYAAAGLVSVCGTQIATVADISSACGAAAIVNGLTPGDLAISADVAALGFADITGLPSVLTVLIATGALAAALGTAGAVLIALATSLTHDIYGGTLVRRRPTSGRRLIVARLALLLFMAAGAWLADRYPEDMIGLAFTAPSLAAAGFFPAIVLGIWWRRATAPGVLAGMITGFGATALYTWLIVSETIPPLSILALSEAGLAAAAAAILGAPLGFVVIVGISLLTPRPSLARLGVVDAIRRPNPDPILEDHAV